jgi:hypothetical protein
MSLRGKPYDIPEATGSREVQHVLTKGKEGGDEDRLINHSPLLYKREPVNGIQAHNDFENEVK